MDHSTIPRSRFVVTEALLSQLDVVTDIALSSLAVFDPAWDWRFPNRLIHPSEHRLLTRQKFHNFIADKNSKWRVFIAQETATGATPSKTVGFAVWDVSNMQSRTAALKTDRQDRQTARRSPDLVLDSTAKPPTSPHHEKDGHPQRLAAWAETTSKARRELFDEAFGNRYFSLQILAVDPQFFRQGVATLLCNWGIKMAKLKNMSIALFASPQGRLFYPTLGFEAISTVEVQASNDEAIQLIAMAYDSRSRISAQTTRENMSLPTQQH
ncbi:hypothetical protein BT63DRAFT_470524 [Microthyrium microscopicum]|uniref:Uncharacterized protein n=1 Tax=Microthyrium microscopicum TaxID=703497 RepID=A0A6A6UA38_9PEZI|nr:hypothetical protein BT63DRAFT_470524 [Microthyrium microscopicum]